jgi:hypothetical protein
MAESRSASKSLSEDQRDVACEGTGLIFAVGLIASAIPVGHDAFQLPSFITIRTEPTS